MKSVFFQIANQTNSCCMILIRRQSASCRGIVFVQLSTFSCSCLPEGLIWKSFRKWPEFEHLQFYDIRQSGDDDEDQAMRSTAPDRLLNRPRADCSVKVYSEWLNKSTAVCPAAAWGAHWAGVSLSIPSARRVLHAVRPFWSLVCGAYTNMPHDRFPLSSLWATNCSFHPALETMWSWPRHASPDPTVLEKLRVSISRQDTWVGLCG